MSFPEDYTLLQKSTIDHLEVVSDCANFPLLMDGNCFIDRVWDNIEIHTEDLRFTLGEDGSDLLPREALSWNVPEGNAEVWVLVSDIYAAVDVDIYIWGNNPNAVLPEPDDPDGRYAVWDDYVFVSHMGSDGADKIVESSVDNHLEKKSVDEPSDVPGFINTAQSFDGDDYAVLPDMTEINFGSGDNITFQVWAKLDNTEAVSRIIFNGRKTTDAIYVLHAGRQYSLKRVQFLFGKITGVGVVHSDWIWDDTDYHMFHFIKGPLQVEMYIDGGNTDYVSSGDASVSFDLPLDELIIGASYNKTFDFWLGEEDELRIRKSVLPAGWIETEYNNQLDPGNFITPKEGGSPHVLPPALSTRGYY